MNARPQGAPRGLVTAPRTSTRPSELTPDVAPASLEAAGAA